MHSSPTHVHSQFPFVLRGFLAEREWPPFRLWDDKFIEEKFGRGQSPIVRIGPRQHPRGQILHDHECERHEFADFGEMLRWMRGDTDGSSSGQKNHSSTSAAIHPPNPSTHWAYLDYKDVLELLDEEEAKQVDWTLLGMTNSNGKDTGNGEGAREEKEEESWRNSTLWIGTPGAYTPCHFDTYGFNLHAQLRGTKRWLLFAPSAREQLWPCRIPYEESSVFSSLDLIGADPRLNPDTSVWVLNLDPGDLLFVPPKWWHSVQCVNNNNDSSTSSSPVCVSVNKWFPAPGDEHESAKEALLKFMMALHSDSGLLDPDKHICLTERNSAQMEDLDGLAELVELRLANFAQLQTQSDETHSSASPNGSAAKRSKISSLEESAGGSSQLDHFYSKFATHPRAQRAEPEPWTQYREQQQKQGNNYDVQLENVEQEENSEGHNRLKMELLDAISSSDVLDEILRVMMKRRSERQKSMIKK